MGKSSPRVLQVGKTKRWEIRCRKDIRGKEQGKRAPNAD